SAGSTTSPAWANARSSSRVGPDTTNFRPSAPSDSHVSGDAAEPDRSGCCGGDSRGPLSAFAATYIAISAVIAPGPTTPSSTSTITTATHTPLTNRPSDAR